MYFYGHTKPNGFMSNFYPSKFTINANIIELSDTLEAETAEQAIMWFKALLMGDRKKAEAIAAEKNPAKCKKHGREVKSFDEEKWFKYRNAIAFEILKAKFQDPQLKQWLLKTGDETLAEASPRDRIWGIGISASAALRGEKWNGQNILGNTLMCVRQQIKDTVP